MQTLTLQLLRKLFREEEGTALTEFVITLPLFVIIFVFMTALHSYSTTLNRVRYRAATNMWQEAMKVQQDGTSATSPHGLFVTGANAANGIVGGSGSEAGDTQAQVLIGGMAASSGPEMVAGATMAGVGASNPVDETSLTFAESMAEDGLTPVPPANNDPVNVVFAFAIPRSAGITRHAGFIGTRYGMVEGTDSETAQALSWGSFNMRAQYDVLVSPVSYPSDDEGYVVGASRLLADQDPCLETVLEISWTWSDC